MTDIKTDQNLKAHYSTIAKVQRPQKVVVSAPANLPTPHLFNDTDANNRINNINQDIYNGTKAEKKKHSSNFAKYFIGGIIAILAFLGLKKFFK